MAEYETPTTRANVCGRFGHDVRWRLIIGPMPEGVRRPAVKRCLDCGKTWDADGVSRETVKET